NLPRLFSWEDRWAKKYDKCLILLVGAARFELATPSPPDWCANRAALRSETVATIVIGYFARNIRSPSALPQRKVTIESVALSQSPINREPLLQRYAKFDPRPRRRL